jgi:hypothetical protein
MTRNNRKLTKFSSPEEHIDALGELIAHLRSHLTGKTATKGSWSDYLRLLEFYSESRDKSPRQITVKWVDRDEVNDTE